MSKFYLDLLPNDIIYVIVSKLSSESLDNLIKSSILHSDLDWNEIIRYNFKFITDKKVCTKSDYSGYNLYKLLRKFPIEFYHYFSTGKIHDRSLLLRLLHDNQNYLYLANITCVDKSLLYNMYPNFTRIWASVFGNNIKEIEFLDQICKFNALVSDEIIEELLDHGVLLSKRWVSLTEYEKYIKIASEYYYIIMLLITDPNYLDILESRHKIYKILEPCLKNKKVAEMLKNRLLL